MSEHATSSETQKQPYPDARGRYGDFGGRYVPETLMHALQELEAVFEEEQGDPVFQETLRH